MSWEMKVKVHKQQIRDPHTCMLGVSKHIDECAAGLTPQFTIFLFYKILSPSEVMRNNKERFLFRNINPFLIIIIIIVITIRSVT